MMSNEPKKDWVGTFSPPWASHVQGKWTAREHNDQGLPLPQDVYVRCSKCDQDYRTTCTTGSVKTHVLRFAWLHLHRDPMSPENYKKEGP